MKVTFGVIVSDRDSFPHQLAVSGRAELIRFLEEKGYSVVCPSDDGGRLGVVDSWEDVKRCSSLFRENQARIDGIIVSLPNFGNERAVASAIRSSELNVPVMVHAFPDELDKLELDNMRASFCGKLSVCNTLSQYGIPFSLTRFHTVGLEHESFDGDLRRFAGVCRVVRGLKNVRIGAIGTRPAPFNTVRFSEKILESAGISVETIGLSDIFFRTNEISEKDPELKEKVHEIRDYCDTEGVPAEKIDTIARFSVTIDRWIEENDVAACAIQCWPSIQKRLHIVPCTAMSLLSERLIPSACEMDVMGAVSMYALQLASGLPSALVDWHNNYGTDRDRTVVVHCGNYPKAVLDRAKMSYAVVRARVAGQENTYGALHGRIKSGPFTYARVTTDDGNGRLRAYVGEGNFTENELNSFGANGVVHIPRTQQLFQFICKNGFEHHVAINMAKSASIVFEALHDYLGIDTYWHE